MTNQSNQNLADDPHTSASRYAHVNPRPRTRSTLVAPAPAPSPASIPAVLACERATDATAKQPKTIKVMVNGKLKNQPTGDHAEGYGRPPVDKQFQKRCKPGPGRPKGSKSQDSLLKAELAAVRTVNEGGRSRRVAKRAMVVKLMVNGPIEKRSQKDLIAINDHARRLFPEEASNAGAQAAYDAALDRQVLEQFLGHLRVGEAGGDGVDPLADLATGGPDLGETGEGDAWGEGDWEADGDGWEASDGKL